MQDPYRCLEITVLKKSRSNEAKQLLERVSKQVQPIMRKRQWTVKKLSEFSPRNPGLLGLNVNRGAEVKIRLRPARDDDSFYDWNHILGTMLHELCHIMIGPHNAAFYKLLDELWGEAEDLMDRGITGSGQGFDAPSAGRLGSHAFIPIHSPPEHKMADAIRKAAEARARQQSLMPSGPRKLGTAGGSSSINHKQLTPAQAAAAAAERRARDNVWCGAEHTAEEVEQEVGQQAENEGGTAPQQAALAPAVPVEAAGSSGASLTAAAQQHRAVPGPQSGSAAQQQQPAAEQVSQQSGVAQQQLALQQQWQQHLQHQQTQRQQQLQQQRQRKRPAVETVDLTLSDSEEGDVLPGEAAQPVTANGAGPSSSGRGEVDAVQAPATCTCCAAEVQGSLDAAVMRRLQQRRGYQQWCQWHKLQVEAQQQQQQLQGSSDQEGQGATVGSKRGWTCSICTLVNPATVLVCEACLTLKNVI